jgi:hypothetical protein
MMLLPALHATVACTHATPAPAAVLCAALLQLAAACNGCVFLFLSAAALNSKACCTFHTTAYHLQPSPRCSPMNTCTANL